MRSVSRLTGLRVVAGVALVAAAMSFSPVVRVHPTGGTDLSFRSQDVAGSPLTVRGHQWVPEGTAKGAVVFVHGSADGPITRKAITDEP